MATWMMITILIISISFAALAIWFIWLYFLMKPNQHIYYEKAKNHYPGSFKGFWYTNRIRIILLLIFLFIILSFGFLVLLI